MRITPVRLFATLLASVVVMGAALADDELPWRGYSVVDETTSRLIFGATKSYIVSLQNGGELERRIGFQCYDNQPILTIDVGEFLAASSSDFEMFVWVDGVDSLALDMRVWRDGTNGGFSRIEVAAREMFQLMRAGTRLSWRIGRASGDIDGTFSLIGFTAATRELANNCAF